MSFVSAKLKLQMALYVSRESICKSSLGMPGLPAYLMGCGVLRVLTQDYLDLVIEYRLWVCCHKPRIQLSLSLILLSIVLDLLLSYLSHSLPLLHTSKPIVLLQKKPFLIILFHIDLSLNSLMCLGIYTSPHCILPC